MSFLPRKVLTKLRPSSSKVAGGRKSRTKKSLQVQPVPALGGVERLNELRRGTGERVAAAEGVIGTGNQPQLLFASRGLEERPSFAGGDALIVLAVNDQPGCLTDAGG